MGFLGTRSSSRQPNGNPSGRALTRDFGEQDPGSTNQQIGVSVTFTAPSTITAPNGTFANFAVGDRFQIEGSGLAYSGGNDGAQQVTAIDTTNHAFLTVAPGVNAEGATTVDIRKLTA